MNKVAAARRFFGLIASFIAYTANAQTSLNAAAGNLSSSSGNVSLSVGQVLVSVDRGSQGTLSNGIQSPYEIKNVGVTTLTKPISFTFFPNPTIHSITMHIPQFAGERMICRLMDLQGNVLKTEFIYSEQSVLDLSELPVATYFIRIETIDGITAQCAKLIKSI